ncbi:type III pantothenate kinase [Thiofilum flexile]|uniref:type III pantothenate kinase n=1 Tax=Thiofilum flexile TaxID=125627 RepID=UPI0003A1365E|nr:type III pantothenate kinase [Thiofilum flexile]
MTTLLLDAGNTRLKWALYNNQVTAKAFPSMQTLDYQLEGNNPLGLAGLQQVLQQHPTIQNIVAVHVLGADFEQSLQALAQDHHLPLQCVKSQAQGFGIQVAYHQPERLGADRFVALVAAHHLYPQQACIVIDAGTGVTIDALLASGEHQGGLILPGLRVSGQALIQRAKASHLAQSFDAIELFAKDTIQGIGSGSVFGLVGALEGITWRMEQAMGVPVQRILTGGDSALLKQYLGADYQYVPQLIMQGLQVITELS